MKQFNDSKLKINERISVHRTSNAAHRFSFAAKLNVFFRMKKIAIIDLGTNGFRLYIAEVPTVGSFKIIHRETNDLKIASEGFDRIGDAPFERGLAAMRQFSTHLNRFNVEKVEAFGTAALRLASNGGEFMDTVERETGIKIQLISGEREAELIYKGMRLGFLEKRGPLSMEPIFEQKTPVLMVDVGGGSVEFIIGDAEKVHWARSFNVGVTILKQNFQPNPQINNSEIKAIEQFLDTNCADLIEAIAHFQPKIPVVACGTFDFLIQILGGNPNENFDFSKSQFDAFYQQMTFLSETELAEIPDVPKTKIEMLAVSFVLLDWIMKILDANRLISSGFSMKAGILHEMSLENTFGKL
jgi:exopolyphosphatase / guanosine-5'-triphosphate,3'-diphosphate pyrophosphatase